MVETPQCLNGERVHYLPHHAVIRQDKMTTKIRIVYDASTKENGLSLNDCLHTGPKFGQNILDILLRFRIHQTALMADIEKAFLMISVNKKDRDVLRFLWVSDPYQDPPEVQVFRFTRVVFGVVSSPFLLNSTIRHHLQTFSATHPELTGLLLRSMYVDDIVCGASNGEMAYQLFKGSKDLLGKGGFKFVTNDKRLQKRIDKAEGVSTNHSQERSVLGVRWNLERDEFSFRTSSIAPEGSKVTVTKRYVVHTVGDPIGVLAPVVIKFKMFFQVLCEAQVEWDQPLEGDLLTQWHALVSGLSESKPIMLQRCYFFESEDGAPSQLYGFCDASKAAYAAVIYLVKYRRSGQHVTFVAAKTRVAPKRGQTIPRLELLSALLLARLMSKVVSCLAQDTQLDPPVYFSDSQVALHWICGENKFGSNLFRIGLRRSGVLLMLRDGSTVQVERTLLTFPPVVPLWRN